MASEDPKHEDIDTEAPPPTYAAATYSNHNSYDGEISQVSPYAVAEAQTRAEGMPLQTDSHGASEYDIDMYRQGYRPDAYGGYYGQNGQPTEEASPLRYDYHQKPMQQDIIMSQPGAQPQVMYNVGMQQVRIPDDAQYPKEYPGYMCWSIFNCLCCCCCLGVLAIILSSQTAAANAEGMERRAKRLSRGTLALNILTPIIAIITAVIYYQLKYNSISYYFEVTTAGYYVG